MGDWQGRRVLITGGSSGIGAALAERFAAEGATVGICARRADRLHAVLERCQTHSPGSRAWVADLADPLEVDRVAEAAVAELGGVDVLVNNAGIPRRRHVTRLDPDAVEEVMRINFFAPVRLTLALLPQLIEHGDGRIVNVSSVAASLSSPGESAYDASKAALSVFSEAMAIDLWDAGVKILVVYPAVVDTELFDIPGNDPLPPGLDPIPVGEVVDAVLSGLAAGSLEVYVPPFFKDIATGKVGNIDGYVAGAAQYMRDQKVPDL